MRKLVFAVVMVGLLLSSDQFASATGDEGEAALRQFDHSHSEWNEILNRHLTEKGPKSEVDYAAIKKDSTQLDRYLKQIEGVTRKDYEAFSEDERLAFLINAYNALTVKWIVQHYPVESIKKTVGWFKSPWKQKFFTLFGEQQHLDHIEHELIRVDFQEPRIHFALVCAARSCPPLQRKAFVAETLQQQLESAAVSYLNDTARNYFDEELSRFYLSKIFKWYGSDFDEQSGSMLKFIAPRMENVPTDFQTENASVVYLDYDWSLNDRSYR